MHLHVILNEVEQLKCKWRCNSFLIKSLFCASSTQIRFLFFSFTLMHILARVLSCLRERAHFNFLELLKNRKRQKKLFSHFVPEIVFSFCARNSFFSFNYVRYANLCMRVCLPFCSALCVCFIIVIQDISIC